MLISALIFGLLGSFHCLGMCGPIAFMLPIDRQNQKFLYEKHHSSRGRWGIEGRGAKREIQIFSKIKNKIKKISILRKP